MGGNGQKSASKTKTVLIADDDPSIRLVLSKFLPALGYTVVGEAGTGGEAIELALQAHPHLILMDSRMPSPDGIEASRSINESNPTPVVLMTAHTDSETVERAKEAGIVAFLRKPFDMEELKPTMELALGVFERLQMLRGKVRELEGKLEKRRVIEQAKGVLVERRKITEQEAFSQMRRYSMNSRRPMHEVAQAIIVGLDCLKEEALEPRPDASCPRCMIKY